MPCPNCGAEMPEGQAFCNNCGKPMQAAAPPPAPPEQAPTALTPGGPAAAPPPGQPGVAPPFQPAPAAGFAPAGPPPKKSKKGMTIAIVSVAAVLVIVAVVLVLVFTVFKKDSGSEDKAAGYAKAGYTLIQSASTKGQALGDAIDKFGTDIEAGNIASQEEYEKRLNKLKSDEKSVQSDLDKAIAEIEKINKLEGAEQYKKFAVASLAAIELVKDVSAQTINLVDVMDKYIQQALSGTEPNEAEMIAELEKLKTKLLKTGEEAKTALEKAKSLYQSLPQQ